MSNITQNCESCGRAFLIIDREQEFLCGQNLPFPKNCPNCRQKRRLELRGSEQKLFKTKCRKCGKDIVVSYDPEKTENMILCREDYQKYFEENDTIISDPLPEIN